MREDETRAPAGSAGRPRRRGAGRRPALPLRLRPDVAAALEAEARRNGTSKVAIVEELLVDRYALPTVHPQQLELTT